MSHLSLTQQMTVLVKVLPWEAGMGRQSGSDLDVHKSGFIGAGELLEGGLDVSQLVPQCSILLAHTASLLCTSPPALSNSTKCDVLNFGHTRAHGGSGDVHAVSDCACCADKWPVPCETFKKLGRCRAAYMPCSTETNCKSPCMCAKFTQPSMKCAAWNAG